MKKLLVIILIGLVSCSFAEDVVNANVYFKGETLKLKHEYQMFVKIGGRWGEVPKGFDGARVSSPEIFKNVHSESLSFKVKKDGIVYLIINPSNLPKFAEDSWIEVATGTYGWNDVYTQKFMIIKKVLPKGEYTFGGGNGVGVRIVKL